MKGSIIGIACCCILSAFIAFILHFILKHQVDFNAGARGGIPRFFEGPTIPVFGLLNSSSNTNKFYVGANIDWFRDDPQHFNQDLGYDSQIHTASFAMNQDNLVTEGIVNSLGVNHTVPDVFLWTAALIKSTGAIMQIQLIPTVPLSLVTFEAIQKLAEKCRQINEMGVPILLNFAPEMNGNWFIYGQDPINFKNVFQIVSVAVRNITNNTAIVWSPSSSVGSPWKSGKYYPFKNQSFNDPLRFSYLDTNNDGQFTDEDDCFKPYFPGPEFVDWIGLSVIYSGFPLNSTFHPLPPIMQDNFIVNLTTFNNSSAKFTNIIPMASDDDLKLRRYRQNFASQITSSGYTYNVYRDFCVTYNLPLIVSDLGAGYLTLSNNNSETELSFKSAWWVSQVFSKSTLNSFPNLKAVVIHNADTYINIADNLFPERVRPFGISFSVTGNPEVLNSLRSGMDSVSEILRWNFVTNTSS